MDHHIDTPATVPDRTQREWLTVAELIEALRELPPDLPVALAEDSEGQCPAHLVSTVQPALFGDGSLWPDITSDCPDEDTPAQSARVAVIWPTESAGEKPSKEIERQLPKALVRCCHLHLDPPERCCDPTDCGPCCDQCPTCPQLAGGLKLERRGQADRTGMVGPVMLAPVTDEDYWAYRVRLTNRQAVIGFPKFTTIGIGFAVEDDWNTNLPYTLPAERIFNHISHNKGDDTIRDEDCIEAIRMIQEAIEADRLALAADHG